MPVRSTQQVDIVVACPDCSERVALSPMYVEPQLVKTPSGSYLTAAIGEVERKAHQCFVASIAQAAPMAANINAYADAGKREHGHH